MYPDILPLLENKSLEQAFQAREEAAVTAKKTYRRFGTLSIILIAIGALYTVTDFYIGVQSSDRFLISLIVTLFAALGFGLQIYLLVANIKQKWLLNRFGAERLRSLKFQAFRVAGKCQTKEQLKTECSKFVSFELERLNNELNAGIASVSRFWPYNIFDEIDSVTETPSPLLDQARGAYIELRPTMQKYYAASEIERIDMHTQWKRSLSDMFYLVGALLIFVSMASKTAILPMITQYSGAIDFLAISTFVVSLSFAVIEYASMEPQTHERYHQYSSDLEHLLAGKQNADDSFSDFVARTETIVLFELYDFCRRSLKMSYRL